MPSRGIIGLRTNVLTASAGEAIMAHRFKEYQPYRGKLKDVLTVLLFLWKQEQRLRMLLINCRIAVVSLFSLQDDVYAGQVVGEHAKDNDLVVNVTKSKKLTNMRASGSDDKARIIPPLQFSLRRKLWNISRKMNM